jgi:hypothetical protein
MHVFGRFYWSKRGFGKSKLEMAAELAAIFVSPKSFLADSKNPRG